MNVILSINDIHIQALDVIRFIEQWMINMFPIERH
jgi:hypothetical protein